MKNYTITVNGNVYEVAVEESGAAPVVNAPVVAKQEVSKPVAAPAKAVASAPASSAAGSVKVQAGTPGKVVSVEAKVGQNVKAGDVVVTIEAMKMEIPVVASQDGVIASIDVSVGDSVDSGAVLATLN